MKSVAGAFSVPFTSLLDSLHLLYPCESPCSTGIRNDTVNRITLLRPIFSGKNPIWRIDMTKLSKRKYRVKFTLSIEG